jgi:hypothetical protein
MSWHLLLLGWASTHELMPQQFSKQLLKCRLQIVCIYVINSVTGYQVSKTIEFVSFMG